MQFRVLELRLQQPSARRDDCVLLVLVPHVCGCLPARFLMYQHTCFEQVNLRQIEVPIARLGGAERDAGSVLAESGHAWSKIVESLRQHCAHGKFECTGFRVRICRAFDACSVRYPDRSHFQCIVAEQRRVEIVDKCNRADLQLSPRHGQQVPFRQLCR